MANKLKTMLQILRMLQLLSKGNGPVHISKELGISKNTVKKYRDIFKATSLSYQQLIELSQDSLATLVYDEKEGQTVPTRLNELLALFPGYEKRLRTTHITRELLWEEYKKQHPDGYGYSQFCEHLTRYLLPSKAVMHLDHKPGALLQIDFAGDKLSYIDKSSGEITECPVLVCTLPYSAYTYLEALPNQSQAHLISALNHCLEYFTGVPENICSDNLKQVVNKPDKYEPKFTEVIDQFAAHYNVSFTATRVMKPKDKASVERHVGIAYARVYAMVEQMELYSLSELNFKIKEYLEKLNNALLQRKSNSRRDIFEQYEKPMLSPLPDKPFVIKHQAQAKVQRNYHIVLGEDWHNYSTPYQYIGKKVMIVYDSCTVEIYCQQTRIALHGRDCQKHGYTTSPEHMPPNHKISAQIGGYTPDYFLDQSKEIGTFTHQVIKTIIDSKFFSQQTFKSCLGILRLKEKYGKQRLDRACEMTINSPRINYYTVKNILSNNRDKLLDEQEHNDVTSCPHRNIRGSAAYGDLFDQIANN